MTDPARPPAAAAEPAAAEPVDLERIGHPRGTLVIVIVYGLLFGLSWLGLYLYRFLPGGAPHP